MSYPKLTPGIRAALANGNQNSLGFSILEHLDRLTPAKGKNRYLCPACGGNNFTVGRQSGKYQCWNGCPTKDIREAIRPWSEVVKGGDRPYYRSSKPQTKVRKLNPILISGDVRLAKFSEIPTDRPQKTKRPDQNHGEVTEVTYKYGEGHWVTRTEWPDSTKPKGKDKKILPYYRNSEGKAICGKGDGRWEAYRLSETVKEIESLIKEGQAPALVIAEGEECVEEARSLGVPAITFQGGSWTEDEIKNTLDLLKAAGLKAVVIFPDHDVTGQRKAEKIQKVCDEQRMPCLSLDPLDIWPEMPEKGDIVDMTRAGMDREEIIKRLEAAFASKRDELERLYNQEEESDESSSTFDAVEEFNQSALEALYSDKSWICVNDILYEWKGTYYKPSSDVVEKRRIAEYCNQYAVRNAKTGWIGYPYANPHSVKRTLEWTKICLGIESTLTNPPGLNCTNGVLEITFNPFTGEPSWELVEHDPDKHLYLYEPLVKYDPTADPTHCDHLLEALEPDYREIVLKTVAASLDLGSVRKFKGRDIRALLMKGDGNNGKDSVREISSLLYGRHGLTSIPLGAFKQADNGRLFPVARLEHSRINWPSENQKGEAIDKLQSLKIAITGDDSFTIERKGKDDYERPIKSVFLFNINEAPQLEGSLEAIKSRYAVVPFTRTYVSRPDPDKGELKADPRFKYDSQFLQKEVLPAFLNLLLGALKRLMAEGINYDAAADAMSAIKCESRHLYQFAKDTRLTEDRQAKTYAGEIWAKLQSWYIANGHLEVEEGANGKEKLVWSELPNSRDKLCKGANQVPARFGLLFPKIRKGRDEKGSYLLGLKFKSDGDDEGGNGEGGSPNSDATASGMMQMADAVFLTQQQTDAVDAVFHTSENENIVSSLSAELKCEANKCIEGISPDPLTASCSYGAGLTASANCVRNDANTVQSVSPETKFTLLGLEVIANGYRGRVVEVADDLAEISFATQGKPVLKVVPVSELRPFEFEIGQTVRVQRLNDEAPWYGQVEVLPTWLHNFLVVCPPDCVECAAVSDWADGECVQPCI